MVMFNTKARGPDQIIEKVKQGIADEEAPLIKVYNSLLHPQYFTVMLDHGRTHDNEKAVALLDSQKQRVVQFLFILKLMVSHRSGKLDDGDSDKEDEGPNFKTSGKLAAETNTYKVGNVIQS